MSNPLFEAYPQLEKHLQSQNERDNSRQAIEFLSALGQCDPKAIESQPFCFQIFTQLKTRDLPAGMKHGLPSHRTGSFTFNEKWLRQMNQPAQGAFCGVYVVVNETDGQGRFVSNITNVRALFVELDHGGLNQNHISEFVAHFHPSIVVESSPGKLHCYWLLVPGSCPLEKFSLVQQLLQKRFQNLRAGTEAKDLPRVLRVPGFLHLKNLSKPFTVTLHHCQKDLIYTPDEVFAAVGIDQQFVEQFRSENAQAFQQSKSLVDPSIREAIDPAYNEFLGTHAGKRNESIYHYCLKHLFQFRGLNSLEALAACILANQLNDPPLEREELETIVGSAWKKFELSGKRSAPPPGLAPSVLPVWTVEDAEDLPADWIQPDGHASWEEHRFEYDYNRIQMACPNSDASLADRIFQKYGPRINFSSIGGYYVYNDLIWANAQGAGERLLFQHMTESFATVPYEPEVQTCYTNAKGQLDSAKLSTFQKDLHSTSRLSQVATLLSKRPEIETSTDQFNRAEEADVIAAPNGILDLKLGRLVEPDPKYRLTHIMGAPFIPSAQCPTWEYFVRSAMGEDPDLISYLQKVTGYFMSGRTHLQCIFVALGRPGTGKSVYLQVMQKLLAGYCSELHKTTLIAGANSENAKMSSLAQAIHCRLGTVQELKASEVWDEAIVKAISGNDPIIAKLSHKDTVNFTPRFKICVRANDLPSTDQLDEGLWTRLKFLPFVQRFRGTSREDKFLIEKLVLELPGILNWAVVGYKALLSEGFHEPELARMQREQSQMTAEPVRAFVAECCEAVPHKDGLKYTEFQAAFENYCRDRGIPAHGKHQIRKLLLGEYGYSEITTRGESSAYPVRKININLKDEFRGKYSLRSNVVGLREHV